MLSPSYRVLQNFGLSKAAAVCYESVFRHGGASAQQLVERLDMPRASLYRALKQLETKGFVVAVKSERQPTYFYAEPVESALQRYTDHCWRTARKLIDEQSAQRHGHGGHGRSRPTP